MTNERPTKTITLEKSGASVTVYEYITGRDKRAIEAIYLNEAEMTTSRRVGEKDANVQVAGVKGTVNELMQDAAFKVVIKSLTPVDGEEMTDPKKILDFVLDSHESDLAQLIREVNEITDPKKA
jgi:alpha-D-ribose 1-methylphosphonate 5-triphosphate synthase subunit PhnG